MINGAARGAAGNLAAHLQRTDTNERVTLLEIRGVDARDIDGALSDMEVIGSGARSRLPLYHANIDTAPDELMTAEQNHRAVDRLEAELGFAGQPRVVVEHQKEGPGGMRVHLHVVWLRIDADTMKAIPDSFNYRRHEQVARDLELEFGHERVQGAHVGRNGSERPKRTPTQAEMMQASLSGVSPQETKAQLRELWQSADTGRAFSAALNEAGWILARGDKRGFVALDPHGDVRSVNKDITGLSAAGVRARLADLDLDALPSVDDARGRQRARGELEQAAPTVTAASVLTAERMAADEQRDELRRELKSGTNDEISLALHHLRRTDRAAADTIITVTLARVSSPGNDIMRFIDDLTAQAPQPVDQVQGHQVNERRPEPPEAPEMARREAAAVSRPVVAEKTPEPAQAPETPPARPVWRDLRPEPVEAERPRPGLIFLNVVIEWARDWAARVVDAVAEIMRQREPERKPEPLKLSPPDRPQPADPEREAEARQKRTAADLLAAGERHKEAAEPERQAGRRQEPAPGQDETQPTRRRTMAEMLADGEQRMKRELAEMTPEQRAERDRQQQEDRQNAIERLRDMLDDPTNPNHRRPR